MRKCALAVHKNFIPERLGEHQASRPQNRDICPRISNAIGRVLAANLIKPCLYLHLYKIIAINKERIWQSVHCNRSGRKFSIIFFRSCISRSIQAVSSENDMILAKTNKTRRYHKKFNRFHVKSDAIPAFSVVLLRFQQNRIVFLVFRRICCRFLVEPYQHPHLYRHGHKILATLSCAFRLRFQPAYDSYGRYNICNLLHLLLSNLIELAVFSSYAVSNLIF